jgi:transcriptional regulator NrdR family protein
MINCPKCGSEQSSIRETYEQSGFLTRRRICSNCGNGFITREFTADAIKLLIEKGSESLQASLVRLFGGR